MRESSGALLVMEIITMDLRDIFTRDLFSDSTLVATFLYCMREIQENPFPFRLGSVKIELRPYETLIELDRIERDLPIKQEEFMQKLICLEELKRVSLKIDGNIIRVQFTNVKFPIGPVQDRSEPGRDVIAVKISRWVEIDLDHLSLMVENKQGSKDYLAMTRQVLNRFMRIVSDKPLSDISSYDYNEYISNLQQGGASSSSINDYRRALKASFNRAIAGGYLKVNPLANSKPLSTSKVRPKLIEPEDIEILLNFISQKWLKNVIEFTLLSTKRHGEILNLKWTDIDFENKIISIHSTKDYRVKFGKDQVLMLSEATEEILRRIQRDQTGNEIESEYIFLDEAWKHLTERKVRETLKGVRELTGLGAHVTIHGLRRVAATNLRRKGVSINIIKGIMNHGDEKVTNRYLGVPREDEIAALDKIKITDFFPTR